MAFWGIFWVVADVFFWGGGWGVGGERGGELWLAERVASFGVSLSIFKYLNKCIKEVSEKYLDSLQKSAEKELRKILTDKTFTFTNFHAHTLSYHYIPIEK